MDKPRKLLIIQLKRAGDIILTTPILPVLKEKFPQARLDFLVDKPFVPLLENHASVDKIQVYERARVRETIRRIKAEQYDWIIDFQSSPRSAVVVIASGARMTAGYRVPFWGRFYKKTVARPGESLSVVDGKYTLVETLTGPVARQLERKIFLTPGERRWAEAFDGYDSKTSVIGLVPTHRRDSRRWQAESFAELARLLNQQGHAVWLFWGPGENNYVKTIERQAPSARLIPPANLRQMAALLERCRLVITNDNGPMHLAVAVGAPTVTIYGPTLPSSWNPGGPRHRAVQASGLTCLGCNLNHCPFGHECMTRVTPEQVLNFCQDLLHE